MLEFYFKHKSMHKLKKLYQIDWVGSQNKINEYKNTKYFSQRTFHAIAPR